MLIARCTGKSLACLVAVGTVCWERVVKGSILGGGVVLSM